MEFQRLFPTPGPVDSRALLGDLGLAARAHAERPYVVVNFATTVDGRVALAGRSGGIGDDGDRELFRWLRTQADALLVGTGTLRAEGYGRPIRSDDLRAARAAIGLDPIPPLVTITRSGALPLAIPLFQDPEARVIVYTEAAVTPPSCAAQVELRRIAPPAGVSPVAAAMRDLRVRDGIRSLLCEGGPSLLTALLRERLLDELFLTVAPKLAGAGAGPALTAGEALPAPAELALVWALERRGSLYLRYALA